MALVALNAAVPDLSDNDDDFCLEPTRLGIDYHAAVSQPRHDQLTSLLEIMDNVLGRARWEAGVRMTELHMLFRDFGTGEEFLVTLSNTKISREELLVCLDQRPKKQDAKTHALSVFGDGMKSAHNCLVGGKGNLYICVQRSTDDGNKEFYLARYGHAFDQSLDSTDVNKLIAKWDPEKGGLAGSKDVMLFGKNSPFEAETSKLTSAKLNEMFSLLKQVADKGGYDDVFMSVIGPLAKNTGEDGQLFSVVSKDPNDPTRLLVMRPTGKDE